MNRVPLPTMMPMKKLMTEGKELEKSQGKGVTAELLPMLCYLFLMHLLLLRHIGHMCLIVLCFTLLTEKRITSLFVLMILSLIGAEFIIIFQKYSCMIF